MLTSTKRLVNILRRRKLQSRTQTYFWLRLEFDEASLEQRLTQDISNLRLITVFWTYQFLEDAWRALSSGMHANRRRDIFWRKGPLNSIYFRFNINRALNHQEKGVQPCTKTLNLLKVPVCEKRVFLSENVRVNTRFYTFNQVI